MRDRTTRHASRPRGQARTGLGLDNVPEPARRGPMILLRETGPRQGQPFARRSSYLRLRCPRQPGAPG